VALNEGPARSPADGACCFPFVVAIGKEPGSADAGLVCPKTKPVCGVGGRLGHLRESFCVAATIVRSVVSPIILRPEQCLLLLLGCYVH
jgi:hypothetical protein